jgi:hypothetical protein
VKAQQPRGSLAPAAIATISPRESLVPEEVVQHRSFDGEPSSPQVLASGHGQALQGHELHHNSKRTDQSELP